METLTRCGRALALLAIFVLLALWGACLAGLRINSTQSFPIGLYWVVGRAPKKGELVFVDPPATSIFELARSRGYLDAGYSKAGSCALIKRLAAVPGDRVTIDSEGVWVNGTHLVNSGPFDRDGAGRPLRPYLLTNYVLGPGEVLLMSEYSPLSFDARYFGPLSETTIRSAVMPIITWR